ncbi:unnamed protein product [Coccothraustes coccothraustes]
MQGRNCFQAGYQRPARCSSPAGRCPAPPPPPLPNGTAALRRRPRLNPRCGAGAGARDAPLPQGSRTARAPSQLGPGNAQAEVLSVLLPSEPRAQRADPSAPPQPRSAAGTGQRAAQLAGGSLRSAGHAEEAPLRPLPTAPKCHRHREGARLVLLWCCCDRPPRSSPSGLLKDAKTPSPPSAMLSPSLLHALYFCRLNERRPHFSLLDFSKLQNSI